VNEFDKQMLTLQWITANIELNPEQHVRIGDAISFFSDQQSHIDKLETENKALKDALTLANKDLEDLFANSVIAANDTAKALKDTGIIG